MKEILQVSDEKWNRCPNPYAVSQDIGPPGRVGRALYFDWCKFCLGATQARVVTDFLFSFLFRS
jgi:hypothetical protein